MSWLSAFYRRIRGPRTDAEFVFAVAIRTLNARQRTELRRVLYSIVFAVDTASEVTTDTRLSTAREWVRGALEILEE